MYWCNASFLGDSSYRTNLCCYILKQKVLVVFDWRKMHCSPRKEIISATSRETSHQSKTLPSAITVCHYITVFIYCKTSYDAGILYTTPSVENKWKTSWLRFMYFDAPERGSPFSEDSIICCSIESHFMNHRTTEELMHVSPQEQLRWERSQRGSD